jgi:hypothetical protein
LAAAVVSFAIASLLAVAATSAASGARKRAPCPPQHIELIAGDTQAAVYLRPEGNGNGRGPEHSQFFGCVYAGKRAFSLSDGPPTISSQGGSENSEFTLAGAFLAYEHLWFTSYPESGVPASEQYVVVEDLRTGRVLHKVPTGTNGPDTVGVGPVRSLVLKRDGAVAWIAESLQERHAVIYEVHAVDANGSRLLAAGSEVEPASLALAGSTIYWTEGGKPVSAPLS